MDLRLDANEAWHAEELIAKVEPLLPSTSAAWSSRSRTRKSPPWPTFASG